ncbi:peptidoglycan-binding domain-containing protein [Rhodovulum sp. DZ06]|uniref:peptidoglycan-binding domain-containing protein n=1 Tax=Rhodovulum sp. DZ06 TaxID=3425126 RepID=UPI003D33F78B
MRVSRGDFMETVMTDVPEPGFETAVSAASDAYCFWSADRFSTAESDAAADLLRALYVLRLWRTVARVMDAPAASAFEDEPRLRLVTRPETMADRTEAETRRIWGYLGDQGVSQTDGVLEFALGEATFTAEVAVEFEALGCLRFKIRSKLVIASAGAVLTALIGALTAIAVAPEDSVISRLLRLTETTVQLCHVGPMRTTNAEALLDKAAAEMTFRVEDVAHEYSDPVKALQTCLDRIGYAPGVIDGVWGPDTEAALDRFAREQGAGAFNTNSGVYMGFLLDIARKRLE